MKLHQILFWVLIFFLPIQLGKHFWPQFSFIFGLRIDYLAPTIYLTDILVLGILGVWVWEERKKRWVLGIGNWLRAHWYILAIFLYFFLTSLLAQNQGAALYKFIKIIEFFFLGLYVAKNKFTIYNLQFTIGLAALYSSLIAIAQFFKQASLNGAFWFLGERTFTAGTPGIALGEMSGKMFLRPYGTFSHPNSLAGFLLVSLVLIWGRNQNLPTWLKTIVLILGLVTIILSFSQAAALAALIIALLVISYWFLTKKRKLAPLFLLFIAIFILLGIRVLSPLDLTNQSVHERIAFLQASFKMIRQFPLTGVGLNNFIVYLPQFLKVEDVYLLQPVHNIFLLLLAETNLVGLLIFFWFLILTYKKLLITNSSREAGSRFAGQLLITAVTTILFTGLFDHYWLTLQQNMLLATIVFGLAWSKPSHHLLVRGKIKT